MEYGLSVVQTTNTSFNTNYAANFVNTSSTQTNYGVFSASGQGNDNNFALMGRVDDNGSQNNIAVYGTALTGGNNFAGYFDGDVFVSGNFSNPSDKKFKKNIQPEKSTLANLAKLRPVTYTFKDNPDINLASGVQHGFVAQELEKVYPELVHKVNKPVFGKDGKVTETLHFKSVDYLGLISVLTSSVKALSAEVNDLKQQVKDAKQTYVVDNTGFSESQMANIKKNGYKLEQNYPNPFDNTSVINYSIPETEAQASLMIFNMTGRLLKTYKLNKKEGAIQLNAHDFKSGIYLYSLVSNTTEIITKRMIIK